MPAELVFTRREVLAARARAAMSLRSSLSRRGFIEVDTPVVEPASHGADEPAFRTWSRSFGALRLRLVAEPYLKHLIADGLETVFDLARSFRDEAADATHSVEYCLLEAYQAHATWTDMRALATDLICSVAQAVNGTTVITGPEGEPIDLGSPWPTVTIQSAISHAVSETIGPDTARRDLVRLARTHRVDVDERWSADRVLVGLYEELVEPQTVGPVVYTGFPADLSPQARRQDGEPRLAEQWDLVILGREIATGATEVTDIRHQLQRLVHGSTEETGPIHPVLRDALEAGMPPCGGLAIGFERLVMTLVGSPSLRDVIPFPTPLRPEER